MKRALQAVENVYTALLFDKKIFQALENRVVEFIREANWVQGDFSLQQGRVLIPERVHADDLDSRLSRGIMMWEFRDCSGLAEA
jgi:hypothetical protein